jgi:hypothetical protein
MALESDGESDEELLRAVRPVPPRYELTRFVILRMLGAIYAIHFGALAAQVVPLLGARGLLPVPLLLAELEIAGEGFVERPTLFWLDASDGTLLAVAVVGALLGAAVMAGLTHALAMIALWAIQISFLHVGQAFLGYGWEILLAEAGALAIFLCPVRSLGPLRPASAASPVVIGLHRWLAFRVMLGAGLIKIRGDECWRDLTCLDFHYETQPLPSPLSWLWHQLPSAVLHGGVLFNHVVELLVPFAMFGPRRVRAIAGLATLAFQLSLIASGNLSYLNWLTIAIAIACFDDGHLGRLLRRPRPSPRADAPRRLPIAVAIGVGVLSASPVINMLSPDQQMNTSFDRLHLVNTYGAFGAVDRVRYELVIEGTLDRDPERARWSAYSLPCQPGPPARRPCFVAPLQPRLDWQIWFAPKRDPVTQPWLVHLIWQLLRGDRDVHRLFADVPFRARPPTWIRIVRYRYRFARAGEPGWWVRDQRTEYVRPLSRDDPDLRALVEDLGLDD